MATISLPLALISWTLETVFVGVEVGVGIDAGDAQPTVMSTPQATATSNFLRISALVLSMFRQKSAPCQDLRRDVTTGAHPQEPSGAMWYPHCLGCMVR